MSIFRLFVEVKTECAICKEDTKEPASTPCGHVFCYACILSWMNIKANCPTCKTKLNGKVAIQPHAVPVVEPRLQAHLDRQKEFKRAAMEEQRKALELERRQRPRTPPPIDDEFYFVDD